MSKSQKSKLRGALLCSAVLFISERAFANPPKVSTPNGPKPIHAAPQGSQAAGEGSSATSPAPPSTVESTGVAEVIVTAEKRSTNLQKTPIAVTALDGAALAQAQVSNIQDIQALVPSLKIATNNGYGQVVIRGIGISNITPGGESAVAVNLNGVFISRPIAQLTGLYDVGSLEVLRGPQGTLYGRNATAGSINITSNLPTDHFQGYARASFGNYGLAREELAVGGPVLGDKLELRLAGFDEHRDGYGTNIVTGHDIDDRDAYGLRATLVAAPTDYLKGTFYVEYDDENDHNSGPHYFGAAGLSGQPGAIGIPPLFLIQGGYAPSRPYDIASSYDPQFKIRTLALTGVIDWDLGDGFSLRSISAYRKQESRTFQTFDGGYPSNGFYLAGEPARQFSEEVQAHYDSPRLHATAGAYFFDERDRLTPGAAVFTPQAIAAGFGVPVVDPASLVDLVELVGTIRTSAQAVFAQASYEIVDRITLTAGIRYSHERKSFDQQFAFDLFKPFTGDGTPGPLVVEPPRTFSSVDPKFGIQFEATPTTLLYATYAKGFKSGSFDSGFFPSLGFRPERLTDYEGGVKTSFFDRRLRVDLAGFYYDYKDLQVSQVVGFSVTTTNAATARNYGVEAEVNFVPIKGLDLSLSGDYLHARYKQYSGADAARPLLSSVDFSGNSLNNAPDFSGHGSVQYTYNLREGSLSGRLEGDYTTKFFFSAANSTLVGQKAFAKANAYFTYDSGKGWTIGAFIKNITDKATKLSAYVPSPAIGNPVVGSIAPPRTFGVDLNYKF